MSAATAIPYPQLPTCPKLCVKNLKKNRVACQKEKAECEQRRIDLLADYNNKVNLAISEQNAPPVELTGIDVVQAPGQNDPENEPNKNIYLAIGSVVLVALIFVIWKSTN